MPRRLLASSGRLLLDMLAVVARKDCTDRRRRQAQGLYKGRKADTERHAVISDMLNRGLSLVPP